ncbi:sulfatase, partial [Bacteroidota bacterium]
GYSQAKTPNLDRLAEMGIVFDNAHAPGVYCAPSRTAIFTGLHATTTGCYQTQVFHYEHPELVSMQMAFKQGGYNTYGGGKLFHHPAGYLDMRDWDEFFAQSEEARVTGWPTGHVGLQPDPYPGSSYYTKTGLDMIGGGFMEWGALDNNKEEEMYDAMSTNWACEVLRREHVKPFFLAVGLYAPHFPNYSPQKYWDMYDREALEPPAYKDDDLDDVPPVIAREMNSRKKRYQLELERLGALKEGIHAYLAAVSFADAMLGRLLDELESGPHKDNTMIIMWSDHGYHHGEKGNWGKHTLWERTSNVPFIWAGDGIAKNEKVKTTVSTIDIYPTLIELCNLPVEKQLDGISLVPTLKDPATSTDRDVFLPSHRRGNYAVINMNWRYIYYNDGSELYNLQEDPNEWYNLAGDEKYAQIIEDLKKSAPSEFAPAGTLSKDLKLIVEGESFHWEKKVKK